ncbi:hypothetical protein [Algivirga pacifica]|uniref:Uncharacterized protein n=1 Tax=Algivirga pacifica TaxID=1162670 RepID=A0ABP9DHA4_9BACT
MKFPKKIPIERLEDYHTHYIGTYEDGKQFWGYETFVITKRDISPYENWQQYRREYAVLYLFDSEGNFQEVKHEFAGTTDALKFDTDIKIEQLVSSLKGVEYHDIEIKPFEVEINGYKFGLIPNHESEMIELQPSSTIAFSEPWDGAYWT